MNGTLLRSAEARTRSSPALSDGALAAYVPLLEVRREWRSQGLGRPLVELMLDRLQHHYMVDIVCDDDVLPFCEQLGFTRRTAAIRHNREVLRDQGYER